MRSIATVTVPPAETRLTTVDRVKQELGITTDTSDDLLASKIDEATSDIEAHLGRTLSRATFSEVFWGDSCVEYLVLARAPAVTITSATGDDILIASTEYRTDYETGIVYRLDASGYPALWTWTKQTTLVYSAGYLLPGEDGRDLPFALEGAAIDLVTSYWVNKGRDRTVKSEDIPGLGAVTYWVGAVGESGELPPDVVAKISPFRRVLV